jgi:hypothetical protein
LEFENWKLKRGRRRRSNRSGMVIFDLKLIGIDRHEISISWMILRQRWSWSWNWSWS